MIWFVVAILEGLFRRRVGVTFGLHLHRCGPKSEDHDQERYIIKCFFIAFVLFILSFCLLFLSVYDGVHMVAVLLIRIIFLGGGGGG